MFQEKTLTAPNITIGLLGGSFDPPHQGHVHITEQAIKRFRLNKVLWLVSPHNPLKKFGPVSIERRIAACNNVLRNPKVQVSDLEGRLKTRFTSDTLAKLILLHPKVRFVWLMGADNLINFHQWDNWNWIVNNFPIGIMARPGQQIRAGLSPLALKYKRFRLNPNLAPCLATRKAPIWCLLHGPMVGDSSTKLRLTGSWI